MMNVRLDASCSATLRGIFADGEGRYFRTTNEASGCDAIIFQRDDRAYVTGSELFSRYPEKCIAISEEDKPSFFLPTICSSNSAAWYTRDRSETMHYPLARRVHWNDNVSAVSPAPATRRYLYSFIGRSSGLVRKRIIRHARAHPYPDVLVEDTSEAALRQVGYPADLSRRYAEVMAASKFALCPRGWGTGSVRLFEACEMGIAPVILADGWPPVKGPDWAFAIFIPERHVARIDSTVRSHESEWAERGEAARAAFRSYFAIDVTARRLYEAIERLRPVARSRRESVMRAVHPVIALHHVARERLRKAFVSYRP